MKLTIKAAEKMMDGGGNLDLRNTGITTLPDNLTVGGGLDLSGTGITVPRDAELLELREGLQSAKNTADQHAAINDTLFNSNMKLAADRKELINELCQYCGKYKQAHEGACDGCRWREI